VVGPWVRVATRNPILPRRTAVAAAVGKYPADAVTLGGRSGGLLTHSAYTTTGDATQHHPEAWRPWLCHHRYDLFLGLFRAGTTNVYVDEALWQCRIFFRSFSCFSSMAVSGMMYLRKLLERGTRKRRATPRSGSHAHVARESSIGLVLPQSAGSVQSSNCCCRCFGSPEWQGLFSWHGWLCCHYRGAFLADRRLPRPLAACAQLIKQIKSNSESLGSSPLSLER
jgi:hypothetical protein